MYLGGMMLFVVTALFCVAGAVAEQTDITVHVRAKDSKFIGTSVGGARVTIREAGTGRTLAEGVTTGSTGDTDLIMADARRGRPIAVGAAHYSASLDIVKPMKVEVAVAGPLNYPQALQTAAITQWLFPGRHVTAGDGLVIELPGLIVNVRKPNAEIRLPESGTFNLELDADVMML